jgi:hypothetical protein
MSDVLIEKNTGYSQSQSDNHVKTQGEDSPLQKGPRKKKQMETRLQDQDQPDAKVSKSLSQTQAKCRGVCQLTQGGRSRKI